MRVAISIRVGTGWLNLLECISGHKECTLHEAVISSEANRPPRRTIAAAAVENAFVALLS
jgi:hypothetical protein